MRFSALILFLVLVASAQAALNITVVHHDTDVQSTYEYLKVCSCGSNVDTVQIKNIGQLEATYTFSLKSDQPWFTLDKTWAYLKPGETADLTIYTQAPCAAEGQGSYTVYVASEYGRYRAIDKTIETGVCENIVASVAPKQALVQPCTAQPFTITLTNVGTFTDTYTIESDFGLSEQSLQLGAGEQRNITAMYSAQCDEWGTKDIPITIYSERNGRTATDNVEVTVARAYDYTLALNTPPALLCEAATTNLSVELRNTENRANTFTVTGEPYSESTSVYVAANKTVNVTLPFTPTRTGTHTFTVRANGLNGTLEKTASAPLSVEACYGITLTAPAAVRACPTTVHVPFTLQSSGTQPQNISFSVQSNTTTTFDTNPLTIRPGQQADKVVEVTIPDADRTYYVTLTATGTGAHADATTLVRGYSTESCYQVAPANHKFRIWTDQTVLPVLINHNGVEPATYTISYNGSLMAPQEENITLAPGRQAVIHFTVDSTDFATGRYVERLTLTSHDVDYTTDFELQLAEKGFWQQLMDAIRYNGHFGLCVVLSIIALILFLIALFTALGIMLGGIYYENPPGLSKYTATIVGLLFLILFAALMVASLPDIARSYERPIAPANESALFYEIGQGETLYLNISRYFSDPDRDALAFTASQPQNLRVTVEGDGAAVQPKGRFSGQESLIFTASDGREGVTDSEVITVSVVPYKPVTFLQWWMTSCWFGIWTLLFFTTLLVLLVVLFTKEKKQHIKRNTYMTLYRKPRTDVAKSEANDLVAAPAAPMTQVNAEKIIINQGTSDQLWVASEDGTKFHRMTCPIIKNMPADKRVVFNAREDAVKAGYTPCKTCSSHE